MKVGVPKEIKTREYRVGLTPAGADMLVKGGHEVIVQATAGEGSSFSDDAYRSVGATVVDSRLRAPLWIPSIATADDIAEMPPDPSVT